MAPAQGFERPRVEHPIDLNAHIAALPSGAACKGLFFLDLEDRVRKVAPTANLADRADVAPRRYVAFREYPYSDLMRYLVAAASILHRAVPLGEGLRRLGAGAYDAFLGSHVGRVVLGAFGKHLDAILTHGKRAYQLCINFGDIRVEPIERGHVRYHFAGMPAFLETYQVGVVEAAFAATGNRGEVLVQMKNLGEAVFDIQWSIGSGRPL